MFNLGPMKTISFEWVTHSLLKIITVVDLYVFPS